MRRRSSLLQQENVLKAAEDTYRTICAEEAAAKIDAIGDVTLNRIYAIRQARKAYDALPEDIDACVRNAGVLTAAEDTLRVLQANGQESLMQKAKAYTDSFRDFTLYYASTTPFDDNSHEWIYGVRTLVTALRWKDADRRISACALPLHGEGLDFLQEYFVQGRRRELRKLDIPI